MVVLDMNGPIATLRPQKYNVSINFSDGRASRLAFKNQEQTMSKRRIRIW
jgi:hypothetical protein